jgi:tetratricopeptide (TPR) repeat protein
MLFSLRAWRMIVGASVTLTLCSCQKSCDDEFAPDLSYFPHPYVIQCRPSAFEPLTSEECQTDWGKELRIAYAFASEQDFYRAITGFKRTLVLLPLKETTRKDQILFDIVQCYYLANKYQDAIDAFENSSLPHVSKIFPAFKDLLVMLYDSYVKTGNPEKACGIFAIIEREYPDDAELLRLSNAFLKADLAEIQQASTLTPYEEDVSQLLGEYQSVAKSPKRARFYQAILPGAGYYYVGLKNAALSSFVLNSLFIWAACYFFKEGNIAAGLLTTSLETGWYFGGINGAGIAAREYNERLYEVNGREFMRTRSLFPILMLQTTF